MFSSPQRATEGNAGMKNINPNSVNSVVKCSVNTETERNGDIITYTGALTDNGLDVGSLPNTDLRYSVHANAGVVTLSIGAPGTVIILR